MSSKLSEDIEKAIIITRNNHPNESFDGLLHLALTSYLYNALDDFDEEFCINNFLSRISKVDNTNGEPVRDLLSEYYSFDRSNIPLELINMLYRFTIQELIRPKTINDNRDYFVCLGKFKVFYEDYIKNNDLEIIAKGMIYAGPIISRYVKSLSKTNLVIEGPGFKKNKISISNNRKEPNVLSNIMDESLLDYYNSSFYYDKISVASDIGYDNLDAVQQDAVLSMKKDDCYLNVVADGTGSNPESHKASIMVIKELKKWFTDFDTTYYKNIINGDRNSIITSYKTICRELKQKMSDINEQIINTCPKGSTTMVMALIFPSFSLIANVGDSTAYAYDYNDKKIHLLSVVESKSRGLSYEEARHNPENNKIYNCLGSEIYSGTNTKLVLNSGAKKILLSSDGVTDLISERRFVKLMRCKASVAKDFVDAAKYKPDVENIMKKMDNISAISIEIDKNNNGRRI